MPESLQAFFRELADTHPKWNFIFFYDPTQLDRVLSGLWMTIQLSVVCVILSVVIGVVGSWLQGSHLPIVRRIVQVTAPPVVTAYRGHRIVIEKNCTFGLLGLYF